MKQKQGPKASFLVFKYRQIDALMLNEHFFIWGISYRHNRTLHPSKKLVKLLSITLILYLVECQSYRKTFKAKLVDLDEIDIQFSTIGRF